VKEAIISYENQQVNCKTQHRLTQTTSKYKAILKNGFTNGSHLLWVEHHSHDTNSVSFSTVF